MFMVSNAGLASRNRRARGVSLTVASSRSWSLAVATFPPLVAVSRSRFRFASFGRFTTLRASSASN